MSATTTPDGEAQAPENTEDDYTHLRGTTGVLSMNGAEIELSYSEILTLRHGLAEGKARARADDRPITGGEYWDLRQKFGPAIGR